MSRLVKHAADRLLALGFLLASSPALAAIAAWILVDDGRPVLLRQRRAGLGAKPFQMFKFRTMVPDAIERGRALGMEDPYGVLKDDPRITRSGRFLRRSGLDELPQLLNVLGGSMSLVGPRPEEAPIVALYTDEERVRLAVKPGLTGPMQVYGRADLTFSERLALECEYIENISIPLDLALLARTPSAVLRSAGAY